LPVHNSGCSLVVVAVLVAIDVEIVADEIESTGGVVEGTKSDSVVDAKKAIPVKANFVSAELAAIPIASSSSLNTSHPISY
jgi:hypothetical protein